MDLTRNAHEFIHDMCSSDITLLELLVYLPGANVLTMELRFHCTNPLQQFILFVIGMIHYYEIILYTRSSNNGNHFTATFVKMWILYHWL